MIENIINEDNTYKDIKCFYSKKINLDEIDYNYPNIVSKCKMIKFQIENNIKQYKNKKEIIEKIYNNTFIVFAFDKSNYINITYTFGTFINISLNSNFINIILTTYTLISKMNDKENISIYAIPLKDLSKKNLRLILNKLQIIFSDKKTLYEKQNFFNELLKSNLSKYIIELYIYENFINKRLETIKFIESSDEMIKELKYGDKLYYPILDILFLTSDNEIFKNFTPIILKNDINIPNGKINILSISSIPYLDYYNYLNIYIKEDEYNFYNYNELFDEDILSICYGTLNKLDLVCYFYKDIDFFQGGEILYEQMNLTPIGICYIPEGQINNFNFMNEKENNEYNIFIPFYGKIFNKFLKYFFNIEPLYIKNKNLFNTFSNKEKLQPLNISSNIIDKYNIDDKNNSLVNKVLDSIYKKDNPINNQAKLVKKKINVYKNENNNSNKNFSNNFLNEIQLRYNQNENQLDNLSIPIKEKEREREDLLKELKILKNTILNLNQKDLN